MQAWVAPKHSALSQALRLHLYFPLTNQTLADSLKSLSPSPSGKEASMPNPGILTKARIVETSGCTKKKTFESSVERFISAWVFWNP